MVEASTVLVAEDLTVGDGRIEDELLVDLTLQFFYVFMVGITGLAILATFWVAAKIVMRCIRDYRICWQQIQHAEYAEMRKENNYLRDRLCEAQEEIKELERLCEDQEREKITLDG